MFDSIGWGEILVLLVAGLFIFGPERLPQAASWLGKTVRRARDYADGAREQLHTEFGAELDELREPLAQLRSLRRMDPKRALSHHLLDDYDPTADLPTFDIRQELRLDQPAAANDTHGSRRAAPAAGPTVESTAAGHSRPGPSIDPDAT